MSNKRKLHRWVAAVVVLLAARTIAFAYIDPGSGMSFVSGIGAFLAAVFAVVAGAVAVTFRRWTAFLASLFKKKAREDHHSK